MAKRYAITERFVKEINRIRAKLDGIRGPGVRNTSTSITINPPSPVSISTTQIQPAQFFGKQTAAWGGGSTIILIPWTAYTGGTATGAANITCNIYADPGVAPPCFAGQMGDILEYVVLDATNGIGRLVNPPIFGPTSGGAFAAMLNNSSGNGLVYDSVRAR